MNCDVVQRRLLGVEDPAQPPEELAAHLTMCGSCRDWQSHLLHLEEHVPLLPVPASRGKSRMLRRLLRETVAKGDTVTATAAPTLSTSPLTASPAIVPLRNPCWVAAGLAAAVLLVIFGAWKAGKHEAPDKPVVPVAKAPPEPLVATLVRRDARLARAESPRERLEILADLAEDLHTEAYSLAEAATGDDLADLAKLYEQVLRDGIVRQAGLLSAAERSTVLKPIAARLAGAAKTLDRLAQRMPPEYVQPLVQMAAAARDVNSRLGQLQGELS
jgi:hypothetical protein